MFLEADPSVFKDIANIHDETWWAENARQKSLFNRWMGDQEVTPCNYFEELVKHPNAAQLQSIKWYCDIVLTESQRNERLQALKKLTGANFQSIERFKEYQSRSDAVIIKR